jgi:aspartate/methionine/tyrosine aminotransferase
VIAFHTLSKRSAMTGYRSGFMAGDRRLIDALRRLRPNLGAATPEFIQKAAIAAWNDDAHAERLRAVYAASGTSCARHSSVSAGRSRRAKRRSSCG